ncbi:Glycerol-3-phosphate dehydrogenase [Labilithrix luteola]|uniref:Glycerol-3-phosphate dehydrogenase [NAD(P)+] n=1 Tax=Labilithrix luteola TaxID=1391654 RepID=A0A0K1Q1M9_9BACT|nr:NAD(P)H-dependent glycerol-3-phosphate dehydrogenase [Labilithrix luteola]AKU99647.1 Glycerol-3-phosphate dehydrogenase [Labilithrix luteola]
MAGKVAVLGAGAWGTALAKVLADKGDPVAMYCRRPDLVDQINREHVNGRYLPSAKLPATLTATVDPEEALDRASMVVFVAPSHATREVARLVARKVPTDSPIVSATKGIENDSLTFIDEILAAELPGATHRHFSFLSGPSFAKELAAELPTGVVIASTETRVREHVMNRFHTSYMRTYASKDIPGVECGGAIKNVIAIAAGAADGLGFGHNTRAMLITRGLSEMVKLSLARGGEAITLAGLAGMGDLVLTCTGELSRNRTVGLELGKGRKLNDILTGLGHVAEGVKTAKSAYDLSRRLGIELPIISETYRVLYEDKPVLTAVKDLMGRELTAEFESMGAIRTV